MYLYKWNLSNVNNFFNKGKLKMHEIVILLINFISHYVSHIKKKIQPIVNSGLSIVNSGLLRNSLSSWDISSTQKKSFKSEYGVCFGYKPINIKNKMSIICLCQNYVTHLE